MGAILSSIRDKEAYYKEQSAKARREAAECRKAGNLVEEARLNDVADRADEEAKSLHEQLVQAAK